MNSTLLHRLAGRVAMAAVLLLLVGPAVAWQDDDSAKPAPVWKASRSNNLLVRSGPSTNDYLVTKIKKGDPVLVADMKDGKWAGVRMVGPTFAKVGLLVELDDRVRVDGNEAIVVKGSVSLLAPNESSRPADAENAQVDPNRSTRPVLRLRPGSPAHHHRPLRGCRPFLPRRRGPARRDPLGLRLVPRGRDARADPPGVPREARGDGDDARRCGWPRSWSSSTRTSRPRPTPPALEASPSWSRPMSRTRRRRRPPPSKPRPIRWSSRSWRKRRRRPSIRWRTSPSRRPKPPGRR